MHACRYEAVKLVWSRYLRFDITMKNFAVMDMFERKAQLHKVSENLQVAIKEREDREGEG